MIPYFDAHCDTISALYEKGGQLNKNTLHVSLAAAGGYLPYIQVFAVWNGHYREKAALLRAQEGITLCRSVREALECREPAALLSVEGLEQLGCSIERLREAKQRDGLIMANLCWNNDNALCGAAMDSGSGLTEKGRELVKAAQEMGVAIDLSHASQRTFWGVLELASKPVLASHSNAHALCPHPRNLTDAQFSALVKAGGGAGLNLYPPFLGEDPGVDDCVRHIEHFLALGGEKSVFMGCDLDGVDALPRGIEGVKDVEKIYEALLRRNHPESLVRDIFFHNLASILEAAS